MDSILLPVSKNQKVFDGSDNIDRISNLPNELICRILSLLPTKYAVRSGILSTRWKNIWVSLPVLDFDMNLWRNYRGDHDRFDTYEKDHLKKFIDFVDQLLGIRLNVRTEKFRFSCCSSFELNKLYSWLKIVMMMSNLDELDLKVAMASFENLGALPSSIFSHKTLVVLKLSGKFTLDLPSEVNLPSLKFFLLKKAVFVTDVSIQHLLCGCPVLEDLNIEREEDDNVWNYVISVPSLKRLTLTFSGILQEDDDEDNDLYFGFDESRYNIKPKHTLSLHTPNLEYLRFVGQMPKLISVTEMPLLSKADFRMSQYCEKDEEYEIGPAELFEATPNVSHLSLCGDTQRASLDSFTISRPLFQQLIHLELGFDTWCGPKLLPYFLRVSPNLRSISMPEGITSPVERYSDCEKDIFFEYNWIPPINVPMCLLRSLKKFEVRNVCGAEVEEMNMIKYFLKNAMVLEKMTIFFHYQPFHDFGLDYYSSKEEELMNYPKGSTCADLCIYTPVLVPIDSLSESEKKRFLAQEDDC